jgi:hypothetical protein
MVNRFGGPDKAIDHANPLYKEKELKMLILVEI